MNANPKILTAVRRLVEIGDAAGQYGVIAFSVKNVWPKVIPVDAGVAVLSSFRRLADGLLLYFERVCAPFIGFSGRRVSSDLANDNNSHLLLQQTELAGDRAGMWGNRLPLPCLRV